MDSGVNKCGIGLVNLMIWQLSQSTYALSVPVFQYFYQAAALPESGYLILAAFSLVLLNALRAVILYNGWFLLCEGIAEKTKRQRVALLLPVIMIPLSYWGANYFSNRPHFGVPAFFTLISVVILQFLCRDVTRHWYKLLIWSFLIFSIQWLDLIPFLTPYGFGWGELSSAIKELSLISHRGDMLNAFSGLCFVCFFGTAILLAALFISYEKRIREIKLIQEKRAELARLRREQLEARLYQEMQYLVHDLKRPLTAVMGLADLISLNPSATVAGYGKNIARAAEQMDQMISEIRNPDVVRNVTVKDLLDYTLAQVRPLSWGSLVKLQCDDKVGKRFMMINLIRVSRALVNLLDNARRAASFRIKPEVVLRAESLGGRLFIFIEDNGPGFLQPKEGNPSGWGASGLGLRFVRNVMLANKGELKIENRGNNGVRCILSFPEEKKYEKPCVGNS